MMHISALARTSPWRIKLTTYWALGPINVINVALYRIAKKAGWYARSTRTSVAPTGPFFKHSVPDAESLAASLEYFSFHPFDFSRGPDWFCNPWTGQHVPEDKRHWSRIPDTFALGDIKLVWEPSRFDWMPKWAWQVAQQDSADILSRLEAWLTDWNLHNPPSHGWNWKCGQETSLRAMNVLLSAKILGSSYDQPSAGLLTFYTAHVSRVLPTLRYAMAQNNNHGTSEAACLVVIGAYLLQKGDVSQQKIGTRCERAGRRWLENRARKLIMPDGSFSQHSITYHRLMLDTLCYAELFRRDLSQPEFSQQFYTKAQTAADWLADMIDTASGDAPNLGSNDGAYLFNGYDQPFRDFRPSVALALNLFCHQRLPMSVKNTLATAFDLEYSALTVRAGDGSTLYPDGGYCRLVSGQSSALLRLPVFKFRPAQSDVHHLDFWCNGINLIRDGGSYSYNSEDPELMDFFVGSRSHSTVRFDDRNQMPKLSHFLTGNWLKPDTITFDRTDNSVLSKYTDMWQASHTRKVVLQADTLTVSDQVSGFERKAEVRWRLVPAAWTVAGSTVSCAGVTIQCDLPIGAELRLVEEFESPHYMQRTEIPVLLITLRSAGSIETVVTVDRASLSTHQ